MKTNVLVVKVGADCEFGEEHAALTYVNSHSDHGSSGLGIRPASQPLMVVILCVEVYWLKFTKSSLQRLTYGLTILLFT